MRALALGLALGALACATGCGSQLGLGRARTLDAGKTRGSVGLELDALSPHSSDQQSPILPWVLTRVGVHHGVTDRVEVGGRFWAFALPNSLVTVGGAVDGKIALVRAERPSDRINVSLGLSASYHQPRYGGNAYHVFSGTTPLLVGIRVGPHELVLSPRVAEYVWTSYGQNTATAFYFGGGIGIAMQVDRRFELMPEVAALYSMTSFDGEASDERRGVAMTQLGLGGRFEL